MAGSPQGPQPIDYTGTTCREVTAEEYMEKGGGGVVLEPSWMKRARNLQDQLKLILDGIHARDVL